MNARTLIGAAMLVVGLGIGVILMYNAPTGPTVDEPAVAADARADSKPSVSGVLTSAPASPERDEMLRLNQQEVTGKLYRAVAKAVMPAVVEVRVKKRVAVPTDTGMPDDFFRRYFGDPSDPNNPTPPGRRTPTPSPSPKADEPRYYWQRGLGSGVIVDTVNGYLLTNYHVVREADSVEVILADGRRFESEKVLMDPQTDLAVVKIKPDKLTAAPLGDSDALDVGDLVLAVGSPEGLPQTVTSGIISAKGRTTGSRNYESFLQTDAAINHGNSGGPLVNMKGEIIGINAAIVSQTGVNEGIGLAIPSNMARNVMLQLIEHGAVTRGYLGVTIQDVDARLSKTFKLPDANGALVTRVLEKSPAAEAGIKEEDFIVAVGGQDVRSVNELRNRVAAHKPGESVDIGFYRGGEKKTAKIKIVAQPAEISSVGGAPTPTAPAERNYGLEVKTLTNDLARRLGFKDGSKGVVVTDVEEGSDAQEQGIETGMVIDRVEDKDVASAEEFASVIKAVKGKQVRLRIVTADNMRRYFVISAK